MKQIESRELGKLYKSGEIIFRQGERSDRFFVIQKGLVLITRESSAGKIMQVEIGPGEIFGIASLFTASRERFSTAMAMEDSQILSIDEKIFVNRLHQDPSIAFRIIRHLSQRLFDVARGQVDVSRKKGFKKRKNEKKQISDGKNPETKLPNVHDFSVGLHFLIVEDDNDFFCLIRNWLEASVEGRHDLNSIQPYKLSHATTFKDAESLLSKDKYDLILLDLNLPDSQGYDQTFLRMQEKAFDTPIIILTGEDDDHKSIQAVDEGAQDYLVKGHVNRRDLVISIHHALSRYKMRNEHLDDIEFPRNKDDKKNIAVFLRDWLNRCVNPL